MWRHCSWTKCPLIVISLLKPMLTASVLMNNVGTCPGSKWASTWLFTAWVDAFKKVDCRTVGTCHDKLTPLGKSCTVLTAAPVLTTSSPEMFSTISRFPAGTAEKEIWHAWPPKLQEVVQLNVLLSLVRVKIRCRHHDAGSRGALNDRRRQAY
jgi:hypothetical protein